MAVIKGVAESTGQMIWTGAGLVMDHAPGCISGCNRLVIGQPSSSVSWPGRQTLGVGAVVGTWKCPAFLVRGSSLAAFRQQADMVLGVNPGVHHVPAYPL